MEAVLYGETSVNFFQIVWRRIPERTRWGKRCGCGMESSPSINIAKNLALLYVDRATKGTHTEIL
jgi:hypothetical protein